MGWLMCVMAMVMGFYIEVHTNLSPGKWCVSICKMAITFMQTWWERALLCSSWWKHHSFDSGQGNSTAIAVASTRFSCRISSLTSTWRWISRSIHHRREIIVFINHVWIRSYCANLLNQIVSISMETCTVSGIFSDRKCSRSLEWCLAPGTFGASCLCRDGFNTIAITISIPRGMVFSYWGSVSRRWRSSNCTWFYPRQPRHSYGMDPSIPHVDNQKWTWRWWWFCDSVSPRLLCDRVWAKP